jgi:hypothetical protein
MLGLGPDMVIDTPFFHCFCCGRRFRPELEAAEGRFIQAWKVPACARCIRDNSLGLSADHPAIQRLARNGIVLSPLGGFIPWPDQRKPHAASWELSPEPIGRR